MSKISILVKFSKNFDLGQILTKISIFGKNFLKLRQIWFWSKKFFEKFRFWSNFRRITFLVKFSKRKSILIKILEILKNVDFSSNFRKKFSKNFDFGQNLRKIPIFFQNFRKISIWVKSLENFDFGQIFEKFRFWSKFFKIFDLFENLEKFRCWSNFRKLRFWSNYRKKFRF